MTATVFIGLPTYNRPDGLRQSLECLTAQTWRGLGVIDAPRRLIGA